MDDVLSLPLSECGCSEQTIASMADSLETFVGFECAKSIGTSLRENVVRNSDAYKATDRQLRRIYVKLLQGATTESVLHDFPSPTRRLAHRIKTYADDAKLHLEVNQGVHRERQWNMIGAITTRMGAHKKKKA